MQPLPELTTERLSLRRPQSSDIPDIVPVINHPVIAEMTLNIPHPYRADDAVGWVNRAIEGEKEDSHFIFVIRRTEDDALIGGMGLDINTRFNRGELGFWIGEPYWGHGYATEAARALLQFGFETAGLQKITGTHMLKNPGSGRVMQKAGMIKEGQLKDHIRKEGNYYSLIQYRMTKEEYGLDSE